MRFLRKISKKDILKSSLLMMCFLCLSLGLGLCLIKSPDIKVQDHVQIIAHYQNKIDQEDLGFGMKEFLLQEQKDLIYQAINIHPNAAKIWADLSITLAQSDDLAAALKASDIAWKLGLANPPSAEILQAYIPQDDNKIAMSQQTFRLTPIY